MTTDGSIITDHKQKELLPWQAFKERHGRSDFSGFQVDPETFIERSDMLEGLEYAFSTAEIDNVIKALPNDKSLGPDGFNNELLKKCWPTIKNDFYLLCQAFHHNLLCLKIKV